MRGAHYRPQISLDNRVGRNWTIAVGIGGLLALLWLQQRAELPITGALGGALQNALHVPWFALVTATLLRLTLPLTLPLTLGPTLRRNNARESVAAPRPWQLVGRTRWLCFFTLLAVLAVASELLQSLTGRDAQFQDVARDLIGAASFLLAYFAWHSRGARRWAAVVLAGAAFSAGMWELAERSLGVLARNVAAPVLLDPTRYLSRSFMQLQNAQPEKTTDGLLRLHLGDGLWPGFRLDEPYPDWRGYQRLCLQLMLADEQPMPLLIRIHDTHHEHGERRYEDRFNSDRTLQPGRNLIEIALTTIAHAPRGRPMQMDQIASIGVYGTTRRAAGRNLEVGRIWLTRQSSCHDSAR